MNVDTHGSADGSGLRIGTDPYDPYVYAFWGGMAQVAVWKTARTETEVRQDMQGIVPSSDLLGWWPMNEGSGKGKGKKTGRVGNP